MEQLKDAAKLLQQAIAVIESADVARRYSSWDPEMIIARNNLGLATTLAFDAADLLKYARQRLNDDAATEELEDESKK